jgi:nucleotide-binding universal stress UspA family protein
VKPPSSKQIVVGYRADAGGRAALRVGTELAVALGAPMLIVFAFAVPEADDTAELREQVDELEAETTKAFRAEIERAAPGLHVDVTLVDADPLEALQRIIAERSPRMVVIGHGEGGPVAGAATGSVAYQLVHHSTVPVVVVPHDEAT